MEIDAFVNIRIERFKQDLLSPRDIPFIIHKHIMMGDCFVLDADLYLDLKREIAEHFDVNANEVLLVGSGKLGFSIAPHKRYIPFNDSSDLDVAIISPQLFDRIWLQVLSYWSEGGFWPQEAPFKEYLFQGWIRPDKLPPSSRFDLRNDWWEFFRLLTKSGKYGPYKVAAGLYKDIKFFETYQSICVKKCKQALGS